MYSRATWSNKVQPVEINAADYTVKSRGTGQGKLLSCLFGGVHPIVLLFVCLVWFGWGEKNRQAVFQSNRIFAVLCCSYLTVLMENQYPSRRRYRTHSRGLITPLSSCQCLSTASFEPWSVFPFRLESRSNPSEVRHFPREGASEIKLSLEISLRHKQSPFPPLSALPSLFPPYSPLPTQFKFLSSEQLWGPNLWEWPALLIAFAPSPPWGIMVAQE